jgi:hypothetical protein
MKTKFVNIFRGDLMKNDDNEHEIYDITELFGFIENNPIKIGIHGKTYEFNIISFKNSLEIMKIYQKDLSSKEFSINVLFNQLKKKEKNDNGLKFFKDMSNNELKDIIKNYVKENSYLPKFFENKNNIFDDFEKSILDSFKLTTYDFKLDSSFPDKYITQGEKFSEEDFGVIDISSLISDKKMYKILNEIIAEIELCAKNKAYFATIVLISSILEGILLEFALLDKDKFIKSKSAPNKNIEKWHFNDLINVFSELGLLEDSMIKYDDALTEVKNFRNHIHLSKWKESKFLPPDEGDAKECFILLKEIINCLNN